MSLAPGAPGNWNATAAEESAMKAAAEAFLSEYGQGPGAPVAVVIAAFNEEPSVAGVVQTIPPAVSSRSTECIVVDDGSSDATAERAKRAGALVCRLPRNLGQGRALQVGYWLAATRRAEVVATLDADGQFDANELERVVEPVIAGRADFVNGSRRLGTSETSDPLRKAGITVFAAVLSLLTGAHITDPSNGFRAFRSEVPLALPLRQAQYQTAELLIGALAAGFSVLEVPVTVRPRQSGSSKKGTNLLYGFRFARVVLTTWWSAREANRSRPGRSRFPARR
jgi:glycosyltransferase involved in cell wall biosynthesis